MKILFRILVILVVTSLVGGAMYALVNVAGGGQRRVEGGNSFRPEGGNGIRTDDGRRGDHEGGRGGMFGFGFGLLKNLVVISVIAVIYLNATKWTGKAKDVNKQLGT